MKKNQLAQICIDHDIKPTPLRLDILVILFSSKYPLGAYDILNKLKTKRPNAEPPTVYRVLDCFVNAQLVHRIESQNTYVCCAILAPDNTAHTAILFFCKECKKSMEFDDSDFLKSLKKFAENNSLNIENSHIEIKGICLNCYP